MNIFLPARVVATTIDLMRDISLHFVTTRYRKPCRNICKPFKMVFFFFSEPRMHRSSKTFQSRLINCWKITTFAYDQALEVSSLCKKAHYSSILLSFLATALIIVSLCLKSMFGHPFHKHHRHPNGSGRCLLFFLYGNCLFGSNGIGL